MSSSTALALVNDVLLLTGDYSSLSTVAGAPGAIGERIIGFLNMTIADIERRGNWPELRVNAQGTADGITGIMTFSGTADLRADGAVSVWIPNHGELEEVSPEQFDIIVASGKMTGLPNIFQRGSDATGKLQIQIHPLPVSGTVINVSAYKHATRFTNTDTSITELPDDLLRLGALMHMDAYDGISRGYAALFEKALDGTLSKLYSNSNYQIMVESYA